MFGRKTSQRINELEQRVSDHDSVIKDIRDHLAKLDRKLLALIAVVAASGPSSEKLLGLVGLG